jgi:acetylornithine deacetylase
LLLTELDSLESARASGPTHGLLGRGSLHASTIEGGTGMSTYPESCSLTIERRTIPGESAEDALSEITNACDRVKRRRAEFDATVTLRTAQMPSDVAIDAPIVKRLASAMDQEGFRPNVEGLSALTDAALLNAAGIPAICFGPGDIALAHAAEEFIPIAEIEQAQRILGRVVRDWCST